MKGKIIAFLAAAALIMSGCGPSGQSQAEESSVNTATEQVTSAVQTTAATEKPRKKIKPLSASTLNGYYEDEDFSVTAELFTLQSSLYYPDVIHDMGANPKLFVVTAGVRVRNMSYEDKSFDCSGFSLMSGGSPLYLYGSDHENMEGIKSGKTESAEVRFLCTIEQASGIESMSYNGTELEIGDSFVPDEFQDIIDIQSADDVKDFFYRTYYIHRSSGYYWFNSTPTSYEMHHIKGVTDGEKKYLAVSFTGCNRSDYAQLIEPKAFTMMCSVMEDDSAEQVEPIYISTKSEYIYDPQKVDINLKGVGELYEIPDFICTDPDGITDFTIIYDSGDYNFARLFAFRGTHDDEPYYTDIVPVLAFHINMWPEE